MSSVQARPKDVKVAVAILWSALAVTLIMTLWEQTDLRQALVLNVSVYGVVFGLGGLTVLAIWMRQNWARWLYAGLTVLGLLLTIPATIKSFSVNPVSASFTAFLAAIQLFAIFLLYKEEANRWFKRS